MFILQLVNANMYSLHVLGDQIQYLGMFRVAASGFVCVYLQKVKRVKARRSLNNKLPPVRLQMDGVTYVH